MPHMMTVGSANAPPLKISEVFELYCEQIAADELMGKSASQIKNWTKIKGNVEPLSDEWVRSVILRPDVLDGINREALLIFYGLVKTRYRHSEIANLAEEDIALDYPVRHISIRPKEAPSLKRVLRSGISR